MIQRTLVVFALACFLPLPLGAEEKVEFNRDIRPLLSDRCFACHGPDSGTREAGLRLDIREEAVDFGAIDVDDPADSELLFRIESSDPELVMPPPEHGKPLTEVERKLIRRWIEQGAAYQEHWSLMPLRKPPVPTLADEQGVRNPIDSFVRHRLEESELTPSASADPRVLVRRLSFDLTGLPPEPADVENFVANPTDLAYQRLVESYLQSEHHGERLAMYWLDLVRYADTLGYHGDQVRSVSPYRDYVVDAFNKNKPFDQFTIDQLAGDLLPDPTLEQRVASTYNRLNRASAEGGVQPKEYLAKYAADRVRTTGAVWLGSTFGCAECHDHKFDPFTAKDFYSFGAFFADIKELGIVRGANHVEQLPVPTEAQRQQKQVLTRQLQDAKAELQSETPEINSAFRGWVEQLQQQASRWEPMVIESASSKNGASLTVEPDGGVLASGKNPGRDVYEIVGEAPVSSIASLRLTVLPHKSLPKNGPGRAKNGNLVVHKIELIHDGKAVAWSSAAATHTQDQHAASDLVGGGDQGWAVLPEIGKPNQLMLVAKSPVQADEQIGRVTVRIHQNHGGGHNVGRFRFDISSGYEETESFRLLTPELEEIISKPAGQRSEKEQSRLWGTFREQTPLLKSVRDRIAMLERELTDLNSSIVTTLATTSTEPRTMRVLPRGNWMDDSGEIVEPAVPHFLPQPRQDESRLDRLDLARWMVSEENPLVARTFVNRLWMLYFGEGISPSVDDLGSQGQWPTHPDLLNWLAAEFVESGWDVRHLVRLMVTSATYRQSSEVTPELRQQDPFNRLLARQSRWRLDAEMVRDNALAVSGLLIDKVGGVSAKPYQPAGYWAQLNFPKRTYKHDAGANQYRRGLYTHWQRTFLHPSLLAFDAPAREECTAKRTRSNTPLQSLVLMNDPTYVEAAKVLAERTVRNGGDSFASRLAWVYRQVLMRMPRDEEAVVLKQLYEQNTEQYEQNPELAAELLDVGMTEIDARLDPAEVAAWTAVTRALLNLHETITRY